jgi:hypothetical protein
MHRIKFFAEKDQMSAQISHVPGFEGDIFRLNFPESIGPTAAAKWFNTIQCSWEEIDDAHWEGKGWVEGALSYAVKVYMLRDCVDFLITLTNDSYEIWEETLAFNCFNCGSALSVRDHECKRHWVRTGGEFKRLIEIPREFGPRPALQLYSVKGAPEGKDIPFVRNFRSTPENVAVEGWMAIRSRDDRRMVAVVSKPALFTFQNREYSCIHSAPGFGALKPGESGSALTRVYFVEATLEDWYHRMSSEFETIDPENYSP